MPSLREFLLDPSTSIASIATHLDALSHQQRVDELYTLDRADQRRLYQRAENAPPITLDHFVAEGTEPLREVIHFGRNTLPLPGFTHFQKRFARPQDGSERLFGYNHGNTTGWIGPGYFVAVPTAGKPEWEARGQVVVDYFQIPDGPLPATWPRLKPNSAGLSFFVYNGTRDYMRRVSQHASIGAAYKGEKALDHYFILCRG